MSRSPLIALFLLCAVLLTGSNTPPDPSSRLWAITNARICPADAPPFTGTLILADGQIQALGPRLAIPKGATVVDAEGGWVIPGLVDPHSHMGIYPLPGAPAHSDGNEASDPITPQVRTLDALHLEDPAFGMALSGGVTTVFIIPGSANLIGGQGCLLKNLPAAPLADRILMESAGVKMALGENPKRTYGGRGQLPSTRMGVAAGLRQAFVDGQNYKAQWDRYSQELARYEASLARWLAEDSPDPASEPQPPDPPAVDLKLEALKAILERRLPVHIHCHRADDMLTAIRLRDEFGFDLAALHHATEAYLITQELREANVPVVEFAAYWAGIKLETDNMTPKNIVRSHKAGLTVALHSDHPVISQEYLRDEAALAIAQGLPWEVALQAVTLTPARILRVDHRIGSLTPGKDADVVLFSGDPFDIQSQVRMIWINGRLVLDRQQGGIIGAPNPPAIPMLWRLSEPWC